MLVSIRAFDNDDVFASGDYGYVRHFNGSSWSLTELETPSRLQCIDGAASNDLWVGGSGGFLAHYDGSQWTEQSSSTNADITGFHVIAADEIYGSTRQGEILFYDGDKWAQVYSPSLSRFNNVYSDNGTVWVAGEDGVLMSFDESMAPTPTPDPCVNHGDANLDGEITAGDAQRTFEITLGVYTPTIQEECAADCSGDGIVTAGDAQAIFMVVLGTGSCAEPI